jgi:hypothetical protein
VSGSEFMRSVLWANAIVLALTLPVAWLLAGWPAVTAAFVGGALGFLNIFGIGWLVRRLMNGPMPTSKVVYALALGAKFILLATSVFIAIRVLNLHALGFILGFSSMVLALGIGAFQYATYPISAPKEEV